MLALVLVFGLVACDDMIEKQAPVNDDDKLLVDDDKEEAEAGKFAVPGDNGLELLQASDHAYLADAVEAAKARLPEDAILVDLDRDGDKSLELKFYTPQEEIELSYALPTAELTEKERDVENAAEDYAKYAAADVTMLEVIGLAQADLPEGVVTQFKSAELEEEDGRLVYEVVFANDTEEYGRYYEAVRNADAESHATNTENDDETADVDDDTDEVAEIPANDDVLALAIDAVTAEVPDDAILVDIEREDNDIFELKFETATEDHKYYYNAADGAVTLNEVVADDFNARKMESFRTAKLTMAEAIDIARNNLPEGITARFNEAELDMENGQLVYQVEFETADDDFEFVIDAITGDLLKQDN